jgi:hypothetical protein
VGIWAGLEMPDAEIAAGFDMCLSCELGVVEDGEKVHPTAYPIVPGEGFDDGEGNPTIAGATYLAIDTADSFGVLVSGPVRRTR